MQKAIEAISAEIIVVDNNSSDGSQEMLKEKFGEQIILIENTDNPGFSKANNQGIRIAKGRYVLLLNPDTLVGEETFTKCLTFMDAHPKAGALGIKMIDGRGDFLPESKRALPTPKVSFYKIFGLASLFPNSKRFGKYHLSYLDKEANHEIEILSGAYMWMRKSALDEIGYLDETFFMYGEDIDLSYRFILAGYQNYYFSDSQIIHYKGESTKKGSLNYVRVFYQAMIIFAKKHFGGNRKRLFIGSIRLAVYFRALIAILNRLLTRLGFPLIEGILIYGAMFGIQAYWQYYVKYIEGGTYPLEFKLVYMPLYALIFVLLLWITGAYKKPFRLRPLITAPVLGFITIATGTYMFSGIRNFSRAIVGLSAIFTMIISIANRGIINRRANGSFFFTEPSRKRVVIVGSPESVKRVASLLLGKLAYPVEIVGAIYRNQTDVHAHQADLSVLGHWGQLDQILRLYRIEEVIYDNGSLPTQDILQQLSRLSKPELSYKIVPPNADFVIGPQTILTTQHDGPIWFNLQQVGHKRRKRLFDLIGASVLLLSFPFLFLFYQKAGSAFGKLLRVLAHQQHLVGYIQPENSELPLLKPGLLNMHHRTKMTDIGVPIRALDRFYAQTYSWPLDLEILLKGWRRIAE